MTIVKSFVYNKMRGHESHRTAYCIIIDYRGYYINSTLCIIYKILILIHYPANSCSYGLSREPYIRFTRGLFYRDRREKLRLAHQCANSGAQNCSPENFISDFLLCPQCKAVLTKAHTTKTRRGHPTEF